MRLKRFSLYFGDRVLNIEGKRKRDSEGTRKKDIIINREEGR